MVDEKETIKTDILEVDDKKETKQIKKKTSNKVIYNKIEYDILEKNSDEILIEIQTENYLNGKMIKVKQWVKLEAVQIVE